MHNFNEKHPHVIENVECRCKICEGSILKSQKRQDADAIVHDRKAEKHLQVQRKASRRYVGPQKSICNREHQASADTTVATKASATANIKGLQIHQLPKEYLHKRINREYRYISYQKSKFLITLPISTTIHHKARKRLCNPANWSRLARRSLAGVHSLFLAWRSS